MNEDPEEESITEDPKDDCITGNFKEDPIREETKEDAIIEDPQEDRITVNPEENFITKNPREACVTEDIKTTLSPRTLRSFRNFNDSGAAKKSFQLFGDGSMGDGDKLSYKNFDLGNPCFHAIIT